MPFFLHRFRDIRFGFYAVVLSISVICFASCHTLKKATVRKPLAETKPEILIQSMDSAKLAVQSLSLKISASAEIDGKSNSFSSTIRILKDSVIWVSITSLGIEAARILITKDSIKLVDRLNSTYLLSSFSYLNNSFQLAVDFDMLQSILFGNYFSYLDDAKLKSSYVEEDSFILSTLRRRKLKRSMEVKEPNKRIIEDVWLDPQTFRMTKISVDDNKVQKKLIATYEDFQDLDLAEGMPAKQFAYKTTIKVESVKPAALEYIVSKVLVNKDLEFPFTIPEKYERMK